MNKKLNAYIFNNAEYEDVILCDEHDHKPQYGMWVHDIVEENIEEDIICEDCSYVEA
jgi:hypothetical protein